MPSADPAVPGAQDTTASIVVRNLTLLVLSFMMSAVVNIVPQLFFARVVPDSKAWWLSVCLLAGTVMSWAGVRLSKPSLWWSRRASPAAHTAVVAGGLLLTGVAFGASFLVSGIVMFIALNLAIRFGANYAMNHLDRVSVEVAGVAKRGLNDQVSTGYRLLGMLLAPVWFGFLFDAKVATTVLVVVLTLVLVGAALPLTTKQVPPPVGPKPTHRSGTLDPVDRYVLIYANLVFAALYVFAANVVYILADYLQTPDPEAWAGILILTVFAAAVLAVFCRPMLFGAVFPNAGPSPLIPRLRLLIPGLLIVGAVVVYLNKLSTGFVGILTAGTVVGLGYGSFQLDIREYLTRAREDRGKTGFVTHYNNLANTSALLAFGIMLVLSTLTERMDMDMNRWALWAVLLISVGTVPMVFLAHASQDR